MPKVKFDDGTVINFDQVPNQQDIDEAYSQVKGIGASQQVEKPKPTFYSEAIAPVLEGGSTFAAGIPRLVAKAQGQGMEEATFPEQQTVPGKLLRGASEVVGFTAGLPGRAALLAGRGVGKFVGKGILGRAAKGAVAGATGMAVAGSDLEDRGKGAITGAVTGGAISGLSPVVSAGFKKLGRGLSAVSGVEKEVYEEAQQRGFRNVLQSKYYTKKLPAQIQDRIEQNLDEIHSAAGDEYDKLTTPLKKIPFDITKFRGEVIKIANRVKQNPFDTDVSKVDNAILDGVVNKAKVSNLGQALDLRRSLDDIIYSNKGDLKSSFGKKVRDLLNKELHKNTELKNVDSEWTNFLDVLKEGKKVLSDTGEKILDRFGKMTDKQKQMLVNLEQKIGGLPFVEDLTNYSLAKEFSTKRIGMGVSEAIRATSKPLLRGYLRQGERISGGLEKIDKKTVGRLLRE